MSEAQVRQILESAEEFPAQPAPAPMPGATTWPPPLEDAAYHGLAGQLVRVIEPHSEADPVALLIQSLVAFGNAIGRGPHFLAEADPHHTNLFATLVGESSKGRKGTSWGQARRIVEMAEDTWAARIASGLSSGEGLIWQVRDPIETAEDEGVTDKRLLVFEAEFALVLRAFERMGNSLSGIIRDAWDRGDLRTLTKNNPARATGAHISIIGHVTRDELLRYLKDTETANGFANRFLWVCVRRSKLLPEGGTPPQAALVPLAEKVRAALAFARRVGEVRRDDAARRVWHDVYPALSEGKPGLLGAVIGRAEAQVMRLALIYALLDHSNVIRAEHLRAALALWDYAEASAGYIFGARHGDPVADSILEALRQNPNGLTRTNLRDHFGRHCPADRIEQALNALVQMNKVYRMDEMTAGRSATRWFAR